MIYQIVSTQRQSTIKYSGLLNSARLALPTDIDLNLITMLQDNFPAVYLRLKKVCNCYIKMSDLKNVSTPTKISRNYNPHNN